MRSGFARDALSSVMGFSVLEPPVLSRRRRLLIGLIFGLLSAIVSYVLLRSHGWGAGDFTWPLGGADALIHGVDPYSNPAFHLGLPYPYGDPLFYPLPALF